MEINETHGYPQFEPKLSISPGWLFKLL